MDYNKLQKFISDTLKIQIILSKLWLERVELYLRINDETINKIKSQLKKINTNERRILKTIKKNSENTINFFERSKSESLDIYNFSIHRDYLQNVINIQLEFIRLERKFIDGKLTISEAKKINNLIKSLVSFFNAYSKRTQGIDEAKIKEIPLNRIPAEDRGIVRQIQSINSEIKVILETFKPKKLWIDRSQRPNPLGNFDQRGNFVLARFPEMFAATLWRMGLVFPSIIAVDKYFALKEINLKMGDFLEFNTGTLVYGLLAAMVEIWIGCGKYTIEYFETIIKNRSQ